MATMMTDTPDGIVLHRIVGRGRRHRKPRNPVVVPKGDPEALKAAIIAQAEAARKEVGVQQP